MKRFFLLSVAAFLILGLTRAQAEMVIPELLAERPVVSILTFKNKATIPEAVAKNINLYDSSITADFVLERLLETGRFRTVDREDLEEWLKEMALQQSGIVQPSTAAFGKVSSVNYLLKGSVTNVSFKKSNVDISITNKLGTKFNKITVTANVSLRIVDMENGETIMVVSGVGESVRTDAELNISKKFYDPDTVVNSITTDGESVDLSNDDSVSPKDTKFTYTIKVGDGEVRQIQVRNALYKAVMDAIENKDYGLLAKIDGSHKKRKV